MVAEVDASDEDEYLDEDDGSVRFSGLDIVAMENEEVTIVVSASIQNNLDTADKGDWDVYAAELRYTDADDVTTTESSDFDLEDDGNATLTGNKATVTIENEGADDEVIVKVSSTDPDSTTLQLEDDKKSDFMTIFAYDLDTDDSTNDIEVNELIVRVQSTEDGTTATTSSLLINDAQLVIDGETYDDVTIVHGAGSTYTFDIDGDLVIDAGDRVTVEFQVEFKSLAESLEGATVQASTTGSSDVDSEGADDITASGAATGDEHTLRTSGAILDLTDTSETKDTNSDTTTTDDEGVFVLEFDVTAFESDLYIAKSAASTTGTGSGVAFRMTDGSGTLAGTSSVPSASLSSSAGSETGTDSVSRFKVSEGETETFTLTVTFDPEVSGFYGVQIYALNFKEENTGAATVNQQLALPSEDFETDPLSI